MLSFITYQFTGSLEGGFRGSRVWGSECRAEGQG